MTKSELREIIKQKGDAFFSNPHNRHDSSFDICKKICASPEFKNAGTVFAFMPMDDEINIGGVILECFLNNKKVAVPKITDENGEMEFFWISPEEAMNKGAFDIYEPAGGTPVNMNFISSKSLLLVPGRAFTADGKRLGRGKGFYDRFMSKYGKKFAKLGICFEYQMVDDIPVSENDIPVDQVIFA